MFSPLPVAAISMSRARLFFWYCIALPCHSILSSKQFVSRFDAHQCFCASNIHQEWFVSSVHCHHESNTSFESCVLGNNGQSSRQTNTMIATSLFFSAPTNSQSRTQPVWSQKGLFKLVYSHTRVVPVGLVKSLPLKEGRRHQSSESPSASWSCRKK